MKLTRRPPIHTLVSSGSLARDVDGVWSRLASDIQRGLPRDAFLLNQHVSVVAALSDFGLAGDEIAKPAVDAHAAAMSAFVESALDVHARSWTAWVRKIEGALAATLAPAKFATPQALLAALPAATLPPVDASEAESVVRDLSAGWKAALAALHEEARRYLSPADEQDGRNTLAALKALFSRFAEYHQRGAALLARAYPTAPPAWARDLVPLQAVYLEMRRFGSK